MKNQNENAAVSDVTARMREEASILSLLNGQSVGVASVAKKLREFADSIDAAVSKTETTTPGNNAAMRDALKTLRKRFDNNVMAYQDRYFKFSGWHWHKKAAEAARWRDIFSELRDVCDAALSAPPRNCDVGTEEEQEKRFEKFCEKHGWDDIDCSYCRTSCPLYNERGEYKCKLKWAQMPYEEGGAE